MGRATLAGLWSKRSVPAEFKPGHVSAAVTALGQDIVLLSWVKPSTQCFLMKLTHSEKYEGMRSPSV